MFDNIKQFLAEDSVFYGLLLLLVGVSSFGLGRWSIHDTEPKTQQAGVVMVESRQSNSGISKDTEDIVSVPESAQFVASKNGSKYHFPWCPGAKQMKEENKIWFATKGEAEAAGYTPAANCKGL